MKLKIIEVQGNGDFDKEYVLLKALDDCDIGRYLLADTTFTGENKVSNKVRHTFWFPDKLVKQGDYIGVWTKPGKPDESLYNMRTFHRFYWGLKTAIWNNNGDCAVLMSTPTWQLFRVD